MIDPTQTLLVVVTTTLTILLVVIGVQVFLILKEVRESIKKLNKMLDDAGTISESIAKPISSLSDSISGLSGITGVLSWLVNRKRKKKKEEEEKSNE